VILGAKGRALATSDAAAGNIGFPFTDVKIAHFVTMLKTVQVAVRPTESLLARWGLKLVFQDFNVSRPRFLADLNSVHSGPIRTKWTPKFDDPGVPIAGVANVNESPDLERFGRVLGRHTNSSVAYLSVPPAKISVFRVSFRSPICKVTTYCPVGITR
jgi:hypothetical protein